LIHRDHRKLWESSSSFGAIFRREGPLEITMGDINAYIYKAAYKVLRVIEHKQFDAKLGRQQQKALGQCIQAGIDRGVVNPRSGNLCDAWQSLWVRSRTPRSRFC